jgi:hypothetical protein
MHLNAFIAAGTRRLVTMAAKELMPKPAPVISIYNPKPTAENEAVTSPT